MIYEFRHQTLALVKCLLLQRKVSVTTTCQKALIPLGGKHEREAVLIANTNLILLRCYSSDPNVKDFA